MGAMGSSSDDIEAIQMEESFNPSEDTKKVDAEAWKLYNAIQKGQANSIRKLVRLPN